MAKSLALMSPGGNGFSGSYILLVNMSPWQLILTGGYVFLFGYVFFSVAFGEMPTGTLGALELCLNKGL